MPLNWGNFHLLKAKADGQKKNWIVVTISIVITEQAG